MTLDWISVKGARVHNLQEINVSIPRDQLVVITGLSGSGKSSLAFDTIYAEGQRRYVESLSAYARQFLEQVEKPDVDSIDGLSPAIAIEQRIVGSNPRSTVGTITEIYDYLRLLFANIGVPHCPFCGLEITSQSIDRIVDMVTHNPAGERINVLAPIVRGRKGEFKRELAALRMKGFTRVRIDGQMKSLDEDLKLNRRKNHSIELIVDRLIVKPDMARRLKNSIEIAIELGDDTVIINTYDGGDRLFSRKLACINCGFSMPEMTPRAFSFNSSHGACETCQGLGTIEDFDPIKVVPDESKSLMDGAISPWVAGDKKLIREALEGLSHQFGIDLKAPFARLSRKFRNIVLHGGDSSSGLLARKSSSRRRVTRRAVDPFGKDFEGVVVNLRRRYEHGSFIEQESLEPYRSHLICPSCCGARLKSSSQSVKVKGYNMSHYVNLPIDRALDVFTKFKLSEREALIVGLVLREIKNRLQFLNDVGIGYLTLARSSATLSAGEGQRIRLATQIGANLSGVLYVLDEPSIGLHHRDNCLLLSTLTRLRNLGNTVVVVEHDEETIRSADYVVDLGPGAGEHGGKVIFQGTPAQLVSDDSSSLTGKYLRGERTIRVPSLRRSSQKNKIVIYGARANNLKTIDVAIPIGVLTAVTGVSGSGKSTLINEILYRALARSLYRSKEEVGAHSRIEGIELIDKVIQINQSPIGRTPRSNPSTYTGLFTFIREFFAMLPDSRARGYRSGRFSFNVKGGRCDACKGDGMIAVEMHFLPDVYVTCEQCQGLRYNRETLEINYQGNSIADVLDLTVDQAMVLFKNFPSVASKLRTLEDVGLGYVKVGQSATTLSGGEAQRVKLAKELSRRSTGQTLYILDEPTTGLHFEDIRKLLEVLSKLVDQGNTVVVIEHHLDVIKFADHVIDLGPEGGEAGGRVVAEGTPEEIVAQPGSFTGDALSHILGSPEQKVE